MQLIPIKNSNYKTSLYFWFALRNIFFTSNVCAKPWAVHGIIRHATFGFQKVGTKQLVH